MLIKIYLLIPAVILLSTASICQMNTHDSLLNSEAHWWDFDCYDQKNSSNFYPTYSNGQESCIIYNLERKDSIVKYYYSGIVASIGIYYGCTQDTMWSTTYSEIESGGNFPSKNVKVGEILKSEDHITVIDSVQYVFYTNYQLSFTPIYEMTLFNEEGKVIEKKWSGNSLKIDFAIIERKKYRTP